uniref:DNA-directed DNA polymerase n=1 Tax=Panagrolaimus sp. PS1159 TaxID=55785 RepID=A0AC35F337_9BILA
MKQSFPLGDPIVYTSEAITNLPWTMPEHNKFKGFILCSILPPTNLKPVLLGYRSTSGNFVFTLCAACADLQQILCNHSDAERSWVSAFTHLELNKALALNYKVLHVYEVWDYPRWSGVNGEPELFDKYVNSALKLKVEASGWPFEGEEARKEFVDEYHKKEGVRIDPSKVEKNPGKRSIKITKTPAEFHSIMSDPTLDIIDFVHLNETTDRITVKTKEEFRKESSTTCLPVACFVTSIARLKLYEYLEQVKQPLYVDTDSICYVIGKNDKPLNEGKYLGQMSREYSDKKILEFVCGGPKNYALLLEAQDGTISAELKVRGFPLTYSATQLLTYENLKNHILAKFRDGKNPETIDIPYSNIKRNKKAELLNVDNVKKWRASFKKGVATPDLFVLPWGYKGP